MDTAEDGTNTTEDVDVAMKLCDVWEQVRREVDGAEVISKKVYRESLRSTEKKLDGLKNDSHKRREKSGKKRKKKEVDEICDKDAIVAFRSVLNCEFEALGDAGRSGPSYTPSVSGRGVTWANTSVFVNTDKSSSIDFFKSAELVDLMGMLCLDGGIQQVNTAEEEMGIISMTKYTTEQLMTPLLREYQNLLGKREQKSSENTHDVMSEKELSHALFEPRLCQWDNDEWVVSWLLLYSADPKRLFGYFETPDSLNRFIHRLWMRGCPMYSTLLRAGTVRNWSIHILLTQLHAFLLKDLSAYVYNKIILREFNGTMNKYHRADFNASKEGFRKFSQIHSLFSSDVPFDVPVYTAHLYFLGVVPFPKRPPYKMDPNDLLLVLLSIGSAWITHSFWFGSTMKAGSWDDSSDVSEEDFVEKSESLGISLFDVSLFEPRLRAIDPCPTSSKRFVEHVSCIFTLLKTYLFWIRERVVEIYSHDSMDPDNRKVKEILITLDLLTNFYMTLINTFDTLYSSKAHFYDLAEFVSVVYASPRRRIVENDPRASNESNFRPNLVSIVPAEELGIRLCRKAKKLAKDGDISEDIISDLDEILTPIYTEPYYYGRSAGEESNIKAAKKEVLPGSITTNFIDVFVMIDGATEQMEKTAGDEYAWAISDVLQIQAIDSLVKQYISTLTMSENNLLTEIEIAESISFNSQEWPTCDNDEKICTKVGMLRSEDINSEKGVRFRNEIRGYKDAVILRIGRVYIATYKEYSFATPHYSEAFIAWCILTDALVGWDIIFFTSFLDQEKKMKSAVQVRTVTPYITKILFGEFDLEMESYDKSSIL